MKILKRVSGLLLALLIATACSNEDDNLVTGTETVAQLLEEVNFSGYAIVTKNDEDLVRSGFGLANTETQLAQGETVAYRLGSVSKTLTAAGIFQLQRDGLIIGLNQTLADFDPEFPFGTEITLGQLLSHQSGIPDYQMIVEQAYQEGESFSSAEIYEIIQFLITENGLDFTPGTAKQYSNSNYFLAAMLIEELTGTSYYNYIQNRVLTPLQMATTVKGTDEIDITMHAEGYNDGVAVSNYPMEITLGAGGFSSTPADMEKWVNAVKTNWFTAAEKAEIFTENVLDGTTDFGMGWFTTQQGNVTMYWHGGDINGYWSMIGFVPAYNATIVLLSNHEGDNLSTQRNTIIEYLLTKEFN